MSIRRITTRFLQFGSSPCIHLTNLKGLDSSRTSNAVRRYSSLSSTSMKLNCRYVNNRQISQNGSLNGKKLFLVDTLALVRRLEAQGVPTKQAEAITGAVIQVLQDGLEDVSRSFVSKEEMHKIEMSQESNSSKFKSEVQSLQDRHFGLLQGETEKLKVDIEKVRSELRYEIDKVTAGQRLDLNLEKGRSRDELAKQNEETNKLTSKLDQEIYALKAHLERAKYELDREIYALKAHLEGAKYDVIKYCVGTLVSAAAVGLAVLRTLKP